MSRSTLEFSGGCVVMVECEALPYGFMAKSDAVRHTFAKAPAPLDAFVQFAIAGYGSEDTLFKAVSKDGPEAARQLLKALKDVPQQANCTSAREFFAGFASEIDGRKTDELATWEGFLASAFDLMKKAPTLSDGEKLSWGENLLSLIRETSEFSSPFLRVWGV